MRALISIHDVSPPDLDAIEALLARLDRFPPGRVTLLVIPGVSWPDRALGRLAGWQQAGYRLAGHGWRHRADTFGGWYHRLHGLVLSRHAAEHLALGEAAIIDLMRRNHAWFAANGLTPPDLYVPPAWALGRVTPAALSRTPFAYVEDIAGLRHVADGRHRRLPLVGFEADTRWRASALSVWNGLSRTLAGGTPVRIGIHPHDARLRLSRQLARWLAAVDEAVDYRHLVRNFDGRAAV